MNDPAATLQSDPILGHLARILQNAEVWVTGGWIRDRLAGLEPAEIDLAVPGDAPRAEPLARRLGQAFGASPHLLGTPPNSVWRVEGPELKVEIWPRGSLTVVEDCLRRDFTCNALQWRLPQGPLEDPAGGLADIEHRRLRAVSNENLRADPVRLLRAPRLMAQLPGFQLDATTRRWLQELHAEAAGAPRERIGQELLRTATAPLPARGLHLLDSLGLFAAVAPEGTSQGRFRLPLMAAATHWLRSNRSNLLRWGLEPHELEAASLGALLAGWGPGDPRLEPFAWPQRLRRKAVTAAGRLPGTLAAAHGGPAVRREYMARVGAAFPAVFALACATARATGRSLQPWRLWWRQWRRTGRRLLDTPPLLRGDEVARLLRRAPGPWLGEILDALRSAQYRGEVRTPAGARRWLRRFRVHAGVAMMSPSR